MWDADDLAPRLEGRRVVVEPLAQAHADGLSTVARDPRIWRWMPFDAGVTGAAFQLWLETALAAAREGRESPFVLRSPDGEVLGSTRYMALRPEHRSLEIGTTWIVPAAWGGGVNVESKLLLLRHAFEVLDCVRVEFKTDARNERSRAALQALPAQFEGIHRRHMLVQGGEPRDSAWYSVVVDEWPEVESNLERRLAQRG